MSADKISPESVISSEGEKYIRNELTGASKSDKTAIITVGGPGSGKSYAATALMMQLKKPKNQFVTVDPDDILGKVFGMDNDMRDHPNGVEPIKEKLFAQAINGEYNILYDGTGKNYDKYLKVIKRLNDANYTIYLCIVVVHDMSVVKLRIASRESLTKRKVPTEFVDDTYARLKENIDNYLNLECDTVQNIFLYDNTNNTIMEIRSTCKDGKKIFSALPMKGGKATRRTKSRSKSRAKSRSKSRAKSRTKSKSRSKSKSRGKK